MASCQEYWNEWKKINDCNISNNNEYLQLRDILNNLYNQILSFEYKLIDYTTPIFSRDVARIIDQYTICDPDWKDLDKTVYSLIKFNSYYSNRIKIIYEKFRNELKSLIREKKAGFPYQVEKVTIRWFDNSEVNYHRCNLVDLVIQIKNITHISFIDLYVSKGKIDDLWNFIIHNCESIKNIETIFFSNQMIHESDLIGYMDDKINSLNLLYTMCNYIYASYSFLDYSIRVGETRLDLHKYLSIIEEDKKKCHNRT